MGKHYLSICLITKNSHDYIQEWIEYHLKIGIDHIYIYDDGSEPPLNINNSQVTYEYQNIPKPSMMVTYQKCIDKYKSETYWMAFIDDDEFIFPKQKPIKELLKDYEEYGAMVVSWCVFGSSGLTKRPGNRLKSLVHKCPITHIVHGFPICNHIKSIVNIQYLQPPTFNPHYFLYKDGKFAVNENLEPIIDTPFMQPTYNKIQINHYTIGSLEDWMAKEKRLYPDTNERKFERNLFDEIDKGCFIYDNSINGQECLK